MLNSWNAFRYLNGKYYRQILYGFSEVEELEDVMSILLKFKKYKINIYEVQKNQVMPKNYKTYKIRFVTDTVHSCTKNSANIFLLSLHTSQLHTLPINYISKPLYGYPKYVTQ